jgi:hypothetical protein
MMKDKKNFKCRFVDLGKRSMEDAPPHPRPRKKSNYL